MGRAFTSHCLRRQLSCRNPLPATIRLARASVPSTRRFVAVAMTPDRRWNRSGMAKAAGRATLLTSLLLGVALCLAWHHSYWDDRAGQLPWDEFMVRGDTAQLDRKFSSLEFYSQCGTVDVDWCNLPRPLCNLNRPHRARCGRGPIEPFTFFPGPGRFYVNGMGCGLCLYHPPNLPISSVEVIARYWMLLAVAWLPLAVWLLRVAVRMRRGEWRGRRGHCPVCDYDLRVGHRCCPECGSAVVSLGDGASHTRV